MTTVLTCENVTKTYKNFTLDSISFTLESGYLTGLIGINGAGKTTLINILAGIDTKFDGKVTIGDTDLKTDPAAAKQQLGLVSERQTFFMDKTALENGQLLGEYFDQWSMEEYYLWLDKMELSKNQPIYQMSKGMKMKFQLSFAMAHKPRFLLLDEPTAGFDPVFRKDFLRILRHILSQDVGILMSTHITGDLDKIADYILLLDAGKLRLNNDKEELENQFRHENGMAGGAGMFHITDLLSQTERRDRT